MEHLSEIMNRGLDLLLDSLLMPLIGFLARALDFLFHFTTSFSPWTQILIVAVLGAAISRGLSRRYRSRREKDLYQAFKQQVASLKHTRDISDRRIEKAVRKGIHQEADELYETILLDKLYEMGMSYFLPLFSFLLWLEYHRFTPQILRSLTGSEHVWVTSTGFEFSAAYLYLVMFNIFLVIFWALEGIYKFVAKRFKAETMVDAMA